MSAEHEDDRAARPVCGGDGVDDSSEVRRDKNVGQSPKKGGERSIGSRWSSELFSSHLVRTSLDRNGFDA